MSLAMISCPDILRAAEATSADLVGACLQADAAIRAAEVQARATIHAGWLTTLTGVTALAAAVIAYLAAGRQVRLTEREYQAKRRVYGRLIYQDLLDFKEAVQSIDDMASSQPGQPPLLPINPIDVPDTFSSLRWQEHALLGPDAAVELVATHRKAQDFSLEVGAWKTASEAHMKEIEEGKKGWSTLPNIAKRVHDSAQIVLFAIGRTLKTLEEYQTGPRGTGFPVQNS
jgi:hypothetical protein